ncbi:hypothetical protein SAMD00023353_2700070 [Rosellinia necatrix]|uniref:2EXR domain-containing protein n=1 Tax=Rosellinia necatrix TaxID=77044 RepID=A0A1W2TH08_ROSNE|nr:hypothetical protein SAMD00023353_2700070 [Rosellinia necatrix]
MANTTGRFPQFSRLPPELRDQIWSDAFPEARTYEVLDSPCSVPAQAGPCAKLMFADVRNEPPPALARVCRDSRQAVLRHYKPLAFSGVVKHINLSRDILLLDSYLQVRRLLKVIRLLSQIESVRRSATRIALGTSWGLHTGLHLRLFHKAVRTKQNMARLLGHLSKFLSLEAIILVVYQRSAFNLTFSQPNRTTVPWDHHDLCEAYHYRFNINFNLENYWLRRPYQTRLVRYDPEAQKIEKPLPARTSKSCCRDPQPRGYQVRDLKRMFEKSLQSVTENGRFFPARLYEPPKLETATLTWIYTGFGYENPLDSRIPPRRQSDLWSS